MIKTFLTFSILIALYSVEQSDTLVISNNKITQSKLDSARLDLKFQKYDQSLERAEDYLKIFNYTLTVLGLMVGALLIFFFTRSSYEFSEFRTTLKKYKSDADNIKSEMQRIDPHIQKLNAQTNTGIREIVNVMEEVVLLLKYAEEDKMEKLELKARYKTIQESLFSAQAIISLYSTDEKEIITGINDLTYKGNHIALSRLNDIANSELHSFDLRYMAKEAIRRIKHRTLEKYDIGSAGDK